jgi:leucyl aminopeptidase
MRFTTQQVPLIKVDADWLIVGLWENEALAGTSAELDAALEHVVSRLRQRGDVTGKAYELIPLYQCPGFATERILLVGLGLRAKADFASLLAAAAAAARHVTGKSQRRLAMSLPQDVPQLAPTVVLRAIGLGLLQGSEGPGLRKSKSDRFAPEEWSIILAPGQPVAAQSEAVRRTEIEGRAVSLARELVNLPPAELYPETFAARAQQVAEQAKLSCQVWNEQLLDSERMHSLLAVARGSDRPPRLVVLKHQHGPGPTLTLVGKGVTFDSGGLSLKSTEHMVDMKCDMAGAAAVLAALGAIAELQLPVNVTGVLALVENMPGGRAMKLGDVLRARNGKTIEVLNTDAEGRLILADALSYAVDQGASHIVDLATLTGACMVALGHEVAGLMTNDESWGKSVLAAADAVGEKAWPLPMFPHYAEMIKSSIADIKNTGGSRYAGAISAAKFLEEFVGNTPWVHLDIAGPAWAERDSASRDAGGTGCFVRTLVELAHGYSQNSLAS